MTARPCGRWGCPYNCGCGFIPRRRARVPWWAKAGLVVFVAFLAMPYLPTTAGGLASGLASTVGGSGPGSGGWVTPGPGPGSGGGGSGSGSGRRCPVAGPVRYSNDWGAPRTGHRHQGTDMLAATGTRLVAVEAGRVRWAGWDRLGGSALSIRGNSGARYYYAHLSARLVRTGARVARGQLVGRVGATGNASGGPPHLHFEYRPGGGAKTNPYPHLNAWGCR